MNNNSSTPINQRVDNSNSSTPVETHRITFFTELCGIERILVFEKDSLFDFITIPEEVKPGGRFHPQKKVKRSRIWIIGFLFGALGGISEGMNDATNSIKANSSRLNHFAVEKTSVLLGEYKQNKEILYSQLRSITCTEWSKWKGRKLSIFLIDGTRRDYSITYRELLPKPGPDSLELVLGKMFGSRFKIVDV